MLPNHKGDEHFRLIFLHFKDLIFSVDKKQAIYILQTGKPMEKRDTLFYKDKINAVIRYLSNPLHIGWALPSLRSERSDIIPPNLNLKPPLFSLYIEWKVYKEHIS